MTDIKVLTLGNSSGRKEELNLQPVLDGKNDATGFPTDASGNYLCTLTYNETTRTVTITPTGSTFDVYIGGTKYTFTGAQSIQHGTQQGGHFIYFDATGTLVTGQVPWDILLHAPVCYVFRDAVTNINIAWEERHHAGRDLFWHRNQHFNEGSKIRSGFTASGYTLNSSTSDTDISFAIDTGIVEDEDIAVATEVLPDGGPYTLLRRTGATGDWVIDRSPVVPLLLSGLDVAYNNFSGGVWTLTAPGQNQYVNYYVFAATAIPSTAVTPSTKNQILIVPGQAVHASLANANAEAVSSIAWGNIPFQEVAPLYKVTFIRNTGYGTTGRCRIAALSRIIGTYAQVTAATPPNHSSLSGLTNDDHPQYPLISSSVLPPSSIPDRVGALYIDTSEPCLYVSKGNASASDWFISPTAKVTVLTTSGDFTLKASTQAVRVFLIGAGGGGGAGSTAPAGRACSGAGGGAGAGSFEGLFTRAQILEAYPTGVIPVVIGAGGNGPSGVTNPTSVSNGGNGGIGGNTTFGTLGRAYGGGGGGGGRSNPTSSSSIGGSSGSLRAAGASSSTSTAYGRATGGVAAIGGNSSGVGTGAGGAGSSSTGPAFSGGFSAVAGNGGGSGGGIDTLDAAYAGGDGGARIWEVSAANAGAIAMDAEVGADPLPGQPAGQGGGGGGANISGDGGAGGAGGIGSGGGGGGACRSGFTSGRGGAGGPGRAIIVEF